MIYKYLENAKKYEIVTPQNDDAHDPYEHIKQLSESCHI